MEVDVSVGMGVSVGVAVSVGVLVGTGVRVTVGVAVQSGVAVNVARGVLVRVAVPVAVPPTLEMLSRTGSTNPQARPLSAQINVIKMISFLLYSIKNCYFLFCEYPKLLPTTCKEPRRNAGNIIAYGHYFKNSASFFRFVMWP